MLCEPEIVQKICSWLSGWPHWHQLQNFWTISGSHNMGSQPLQNTEIIKQTDLLHWKIWRIYESVSYLFSCTLSNVLCTLCIKNGKEGNNFTWIWMTWFVKEVILLFTFSVYFISERHHVLKDTIGTLPLEDIAYNQSWLFSWIFFIVVIVCAIFQYIFFYLYNDKFHPMAFILESARRSKLLY